VAAVVPGGAEGGERRESVASVATRVESLPDRRVGGGMADTFGVREDTDLGVVDLGVKEDTALGVRERTALGVLAAGLEQVMSMALGVRDVFSARRSGGGLGVVAARGQVMFW
jgi:hypothetical protein